MATNVAEIEFVPDEPVDFVPDGAPADAVEFIPDEGAVAVQEGQRATVGAVQALDVMGAPRQFDWSEVNAQMDAERFQEAEALRAEVIGKVSTPERRAMFAQSQQKLADITPFTPTGQYLAQQRAGEAEAAADVQATAARGTTPSGVLTSMLGPGLSTSLVPIAESAGRNAGAAAGGAIGAAAMMPGPPAIASRLATFLGTALPIFGAVGGSIAGGAGQEAVMQIGETPEETQARQQRAADDFARNPGLSRIGAAVASGPFFGPSLAQFGRAMAGDKGAIVNLGLAGTIGGAMEVGSAMLQGRPVEAADVAAGVFSNLIMNEPTKLGRKLGLLPSTEQAQAEAAMAKAAPQPEPIRLGEQSDLTTRGTTSDADVFAGVPRRPAELPPETPAPAPPVVDEKAVIQAEAQKVGPVIYDGVTQMGDDGFYSFSDTTSKPGTRISFTVESQGPPSAEQIAAKHAERLEAFGVTAAPASEAPIPPAAEPAPPITPEAPVPLAPEAPPVPPAEPPVTPPAAEAPLPADNNVTSIRNAQVDAERAQRGLPPMDAVVPVGNKEMMQRAADIEAQDPRAAVRLVEELTTKPRAIEPEEVFLLLRERVRRKSEYNAAGKRLIEATEAGDIAAADVARKDVAAASDALVKIEEATGRGGAGTNQGRALQARQAFAREDYSLAQMETDLRVEQGGAPLTPEQKAKVAAQAETIANTQAKMDEVLAARKAETLDKQVDATIGNIAKQADPDPAVKSLADRIIAKLDQQAEQARKDLREYFKNLNAFVPDPRILTKFTVLAANRLAKGAIKAGQWVSEMVQEFGELARPYAEQAFNSASAKLDEVVGSTVGDTKKRTTVKAKILDAGVQQERVSAAIAARIQEGQKIEELGNYIDRLVESFVRGGVRDRDALVRAVKGVIEPLAPGISDKKIIELISGYGRATLLSKDPIKVTKRQLKGELQQVAKLNALRAKEALKKTGPERRTPSDEERRLIKEVNAAKKAAGVVTTDPATQLKSTMDSARTRFTNEIKDLTFEIETGVRPPNKTPIEYAQDVEILRGLRDRLRQTVRDLEGPRQLTDEQRIAITTRGLNDSIASLEAQLAGQQKSKVKRLAPDTPEIRALKGKRDVLRAQLKEVEAADALLQENRKAEALVRSIERAEAELAGGAAPRGKAAGPESEMVAEARTQLAQVREQLQAKRDADPAVQQARMDAAEAAVEKAIKKLDEQIQTGDLSAKRTPTPAASQRLEDLRLQRDAMNRLRNQLRREARPKPDPLEVATRAQLTALAKRTADLVDRTARGDFSPQRQPPADLSKNAEWVKLKAENDKAKADYDKARYEARKAQRTTQQKVLDTISDVWAASRPLIASTDISAPGRQGIFFALPDLFTNPARLGRQLKRMFQSQFSESQFQQNKARIESRDNADLYEASELYLADIDHTPSAREEQFKSELAEKIPLAGRIVRGSSRGFAAFLNTARADAFDAFVKWSGGKENVSPETAKYLAAAINDLTGRGNVSSRQAQGALEWLAKYLFSPRLWASRFNTAILRPIWRGSWTGPDSISPRARAVVMGQYVKFLGALYGLKFLAGLWGGKMEEDPRDSDFGKLQFGEKRYDVTGGIGNMVTFLARVFSGKTKNDKGKLLTLSWSGEERPERELGQVMFSHLRNKMAPIPGALYDIRYGRHPDREKVTPSSVAQQTMIPITVSDTVEMFQKDDPATAAKDALINALGVSVGDYSR